MASDPTTERGHAFGTSTAVEDARTAGLMVRRSDWRDIFLAITDTLATDGTRSMRDLFEAQFAGPVRDGERWHITMSGARFDVLYNPDRAQVYRLLPPREGMTMTVTPSLSPLVGLTTPD